MRLVHFLVLCLSALWSARGMAQSQVVIVMDDDTRLPVPRASLYTKEKGRFHSAITNEEGIAQIPFQYSRLTVSHLNYEKRVVKGVRDTIWLRPVYQTAPEVTVTNREPEWIRRKLKQAVKNKEQRYFALDTTQHFVYDTRSIRTDHIYQYHLTGQLLMKGEHRSRYAIVPDTSVITASDSTRLTDTSNMRRMLYEDFMAEMDNGFIRGHRFSENPAFVGRTKDEIELRYFSKSHKDDRGRLVIDTARCVVLSATRYSGTKTNRSERLNQFLYGFARLMGYSIDIWTRDYQVTYAERQDGTFYPAEVRYKCYMVARDKGSGKAEQLFDEQTGGGFPNMEATLRLSDGSAQVAASASKELPPSWYVTYNTDADRQREVELSNLPAEFFMFED